MMEFKPNHINNRHRLLLLNITSRKHNICEPLIGYHLSFDVAPFLFHSLSFSFNRWQVVVSEYRWFGWNFKSMNAGLT